MPRPQRTTEGAVYIVQCQHTGRVKIGFSKDPAQRLKSLLSGCPTDLHVLHVVPGSRVSERLVHEQFPAQRVRGEWYALSADQIRWAIELLSGSNGLSMVYERTAERFALGELVECSRCRGDVRFVDSRGRCEPCTSDLAAEIEVWDQVRALDTGARQ